MSNYPEGVCEANAPWNVPDNRDLYTCGQCGFKCDVLHFDAHTKFGNVCVRKFDTTHEVEWVKMDMPACDYFFEASSNE